MSLYFEASKFISNSHKQKGTLKNRVFAEKNLKSKPAQIYGLVSEATKYAPVLKEVIEKSDLLVAEKKLTPELALLLVYDLLLSKKGIAAPQGHKLRISVEKYKTRLQAELTKYRVRNKFATIDDLKTSVAGSGPRATGILGDSHSAIEHPRWVRINLLKTNLKAQLETTFKDYKQVDSLKTILKANRAVEMNRLIHKDQHIPDLLALPASLDLSKESAYLDGKLILQDKASCFPAYLLNPKGDEELVIDACAAPGNKTTHLASLMHRLPTSGKNRSIIACERDKGRAEILKKMIKTAGADSVTTVKAGQDFLRVDPSSEPWCFATSLLLDPSCSGSGIIGRDEASKIVPLPSLPIDTNNVTKKRKRGNKSAQSEGEKAEEARNEENEAESENMSRDRLLALGSFQAKLVEHAFKFPRAQKVTYSTCSIHEEENEHVVTKVLSSQTAKRLGWRVLRRDEQVDGMRKWSLRGQYQEASRLDFTEEMADACIRCQKHTLHGTQGFFAVGFTRQPTSQSDESGVEDEWEGFDDS